MSEQDQAQAPETQFVLQRIYVKDLSFESPKSPDAFLQQWKPQINLEMNVSHNVLSDDNYEVVLSLTITCLLYTSPSPRDQRGSRMPSSA